MKKKKKATDVIFPNNRLKPTPAKRPLNKKNKVRSKY